VSPTVGVDVGGTFTDVVVFDGTSVTGWKLPTTPDQSVAVSKALRDSGLGEGSLFLHGTTTGTNALLEERGARVALVTSPGFEDVIEIGRQARPALYDPFLDRPASLVDRAMRFGFDGDVGELLARIEATGPEAVAVALVRSFSESGPELALGDRLADETGLPVSVGARVSPAFREYERIATTVLNAFLTPEVAGYLGRLDGAVTARKRLVMTSSGGLLPFRAAIGHAGRLVLSGPAAGVVAATELGLAKGYASVISFDMGGTSTDVCRITGGRAAGGRRRAGTERVNRVPSLPVRTIGAGGGSQAWVDPGGALRVGPRSSGSVPGPAAYGLGGDQATVTDANVVLGRIPRGLALGGSVALDIGAATGVVAAIGQGLGLDPDSAAAGMIEVVDTHMERALRGVSVEEGVDPRDSALVAFGGAGGLHASRLARRLGIRTTLIPPLSGVFSALGLLLARPSSDAIRTVMLDEGSTLLPEVVGSITAEAREAFAAGHGAGVEGVSAFAELRYTGQSHELAVPLLGDWAGLRDSFESEHRARFGFTRQGQAIELVNVSAVAVARAPLRWSDLPGAGAPGVPHPEFAPVRIGSGRTEVPVWRRAALPVGFETGGPSIIVETDSAVWLEPGDRMTVHPDGTLEISHN
jgi:N-methylhydantoinase A